jgi:hypothetical protein
MQRRIATRSVSESDIKVATISWADERSGLSSAIAFVFKRERNREDQPTREGIVASQHATVDALLPYAPIWQE